MEAYLDNSATTPICPEAFNAVTEALTSNWGNPSSLYRKGIEAEAVRESARRSLAGRLGCESGEVFFTSGGTESNNIAVLGAAEAQKRFGRRIIVSSVEHASIDEAVKFLETRGFEIIRLPVDSQGRVPEDRIFRAVNQGTILVSLMAVNNEVGTLQPLEAVRQAVVSSRSRALIHCDAVQAFGKIDVKPSAMGVDLMSVSAHKIHGPKGAGALYVRGGLKKEKNGVRVLPVMYGGTQESSLRPGTEPMPAIAGFGAAVNALPPVSASLERINLLRQRLVCGLETVDGIEFNSPPDALPYVTNISVVGYESENLINFLSERGIYVSSGSACGKGKKSRVLKNMGLGDDRVSSALRISLSRYTAPEHIDMLIYGLRDARNFLRTKK
ncbi:MAG: cysteine desulfurase [Oscillospiraceae bacterium]|nr:cysteine desulfurase [Oscillospiraceae bacterium]